MIEVEVILSFLLLGSFVGIIAGMFGIGGGGIIVPILTWIFLEQGFESTNVLHAALGTSMAITVITAISSVRAQNKKGAVQWNLFKQLAPGVIVGTFLATFIASKLSSFALSIIFLIFMLYASSQMLLNKKPKASQTLFSGKIQFLVGNFIGGLSALVSIGGGILTVPYLVWQNIDVKKAIATSSAVGLPLALSGTIGYIINGLDFHFSNQLMVGFINIPALIVVSIASFLTAPVGVKLVHYLPVATVKKLFAILPIILGIKMIIDLL